MIDTGLCVRVQKPINMDQSTYQWTYQWNH